MSEVLIKIGKFIWNPFLRALLGYSLTIITASRIIEGFHSDYRDAITTVIMLLSFALIFSLPITIGELEETLRVYKEAYSKSGNNK